MTSYEQRGVLPSLIPSEFRHRRKTLVSTKAVCLMFPSS